jgi:hypothetical protein
MGVTEVKGGKARPGTQGPQGLEDVPADPVVLAEGVAPGDDEDRVGTVEHAAYPRPTVSAAAAGAGLTRQTPA